MAPTSPPLPFYCSPWRADARLGSTRNSTVSRVAAHVTCEKKSSQRLPKRMPILFADRPALAHLGRRFVVVADYRKNSAYLGKNVRTFRSPSHLHPTQVDACFFSRRLSSSRKACRSRSSLLRTPRCCRTCVRSSARPTRRSAWRRQRQDPSSQITATLSSTRPSRGT